MRTLYIAPHRAKAFATDPVTLEIVPSLRELILHIVGLGMLRADHPEHERLTEVLIDLLAQVRREDLRLPLPADPRAHALALRLQAMPPGDEGLAELVAESGASPQTLQRIFPRETGLTLLSHGSMSRGSETIVSGPAFTTYGRSPHHLPRHRRHCRHRPARYTSRPGCHLRPRRSLSLQLLPPSARLEWR